MRASTILNQPTNADTDGLEAAVIDHVIQTSNFPTPSSHNRAPEPIASPLSTIYTQPLLDPAILSLQRPSTKPELAHSTTPARADTPFIPSPLLDETPSKDPSWATPTTLLKPTVPTSTKPKPVGDGVVSLGRTDSLATATLSEPFDDLSLGINLADVESVTAELGTSGGKADSLLLAENSTKEIKSSDKPNGKRRRPPRAKVGKGASVEATTLALLEGPDLSPVATRSQKQILASKGRRTSSTIGASLEFSPKHGKGSIDRRDNMSAKRHSRRKLMKSSEAQNGWATEDATDIQEMGAFDFQANLSKFDKREIFNQFRHDDTTADEARLVSHNRLPPKPGTAGGKNLHFTENVLDSPKANGHVGWTSEAGESELDAKVSSGMSTRRSGSLATLRKPPSRKSSGVGAGNEALKTSTTSLGSARYSLTNHGSPKPVRRNRSISPLAASVANASKLSLRIFPSNKFCPCLSPLQMLELEQFAVSDLGMTEEMMTENAGRGISETAVRSLHTVERELRNDDHFKNPLITIAAGNHKTGARAIAAARHLQNHGFRVNTCILGGDREDELLDSIKHQVSAFRKSGGTVLSLATLLDGVKGGQIRPHLIIDALLGVHTFFEDLRSDDQATYFELVIWVNRNEVEVLSVDVPSGIDASNGNCPSIAYYDVFSIYVSTNLFIAGNPTIVNSKPLTLSPTFVLFLGAPKSWLLVPEQGSTFANREAQFFLADIGINNTAWKRLGRRGRRGVEWGGEWVVRLKLESE